MKVKTETPEEKEALDMIDNTPAQFVNCTANHSNELLNTLNWFKQAIPNQKKKKKVIQIGCHIEEVGEMFDSLREPDEIAMISLADDYKKAYECTVDYIESMGVSDKTSFLDSMVDQIVTAVGVCHMMGFDIISALAEVNRSNYSKFKNGQPVFDSNGKITKGKYYTPPNLTGMIGK